MRSQKHEHGHLSERRPYQPYKQKQTRTHHQSLSLDGIKPSQQPPLLKSNSFKSNGRINRLHHQSYQSLPSLACLNSQNCSPSPHAQLGPILKKQRSLSALCRSDGSFVNATTFSAPISPKHLSKVEETMVAKAKHKLPLIHLQHRQKQSSKSSHRNPMSADPFADASPSLLIRSQSKRSISQSIDRRRSVKAAKQRSQRGPTKSRVKSKSKPQSFHLDLSGLSLSTDKAQSAKHPMTAHVRGASLSLNLKSNILLQFDLAPKSIDDRSCYSITPEGAINIDGFEVSAHGLTFDDAAMKQRRHFEVKPSDFVEVSILGRGSSSVVYKTWDLREKRLIALKCISAFEQNKRKQIVNELRLLTSLSSSTDVRLDLCADPCRDIVSFYGAHFVEGQIIFSLELLDLGSLQELLELNGAMRAEMVSFILRGVLRAIAYLHSRKLIYRDLKPSNILIASDGAVKLSDFGIVHQFEDTDKVYRCEEVIGTTVYMSPQRLGGKTYSFASDIWSIGLCVAQSLFPPILEHFPLSNVKDVEEHLFAERAEHGMDVDAVAFMRWCLREEEADRLSAKELSEHAFITKFAQCQRADFKEYLASSKVQTAMKERAEHELVSMEQSLRGLFIQNKIDRNAMQMPMDEIRKALRSRE